MLKNSSKMLKNWKLYMKLVADAYASAPDYDPKAAPAWLELMKGVEKAFGQKTNKRQAPSIEYVQHDPYKSPHEMIQDINQNNRLMISTIGNSHPVFDALQNLKLRTVHDMVHAGHSPDKENGHAFSFAGEVGAYNQHIKYLVSAGARAALFTEVVGQAAYYLTYGKFPKQKIAFLPGFDYQKVGMVSGYQVGEDKKLRPTDPNQQVDPSLLDDENPDPRVPPVSPPVAPDEQPVTLQQKSLVANNWFQRMRVG